MSLLWKSSAARQNDARLLSRGRLCGPYFLCIGLLVLVQPNCGSSIAPQRPGSGPRPPSRFASGSASQFLDESSPRHPQQSQEVAFRFWNVTAQLSAGQSSRSLFAVQTAPIDQPGYARKSTLSDFAWLEGKWSGSWGPRIAEQIWTPPRAGQMLGLFRAVENNNTLVIELFSLSETPHGVELRFRHFTPALVPWEQAGATTMKLTSLDTKAAIFENDAGGQPKRDVFTRIDPDTYIFKSDIAPDTGAGYATEIRYHRQK
jgi:hypothetical protein